MENKVRIVMIGAGNIANVHLSAYKSNPDAEIVALCDIDKARLNKTGDLFGIEKRYTDVETMLREVEADAADVCVWNINHAKCAIAALNAGLHVLCEKPMAYTAGEAEEMVAAAKKAGKLLMVGFVCRFNRDTEIALDFIENGYIGDIYYAKATYLRRHGNPGGWFADKARSGGGPVIDLGVHVLDLTRYLMGCPKPVSVFASTSNRLGPRLDLKNKPGWVPDKSEFDTDVNDVEDFGTALVRYDNGAMVLLETSYDFNGESCGKREIYGTKGGMIVTDKDPKIYTTMNGYLMDLCPQIPESVSGKYSFDAEMQNFTDAILGKAACKAPMEDGVVVMKILDAIYESSRTGHEVLL